MNCEKHFNKTTKERTRKGVTSGASIVSKRQQKIKGKERKKKYPIYLVRICPQRFPFCVISLVQRNATVLSVNTVSPSRAFRPRLAPCVERMGVTASKTPGPMPCQAVAVEQSRDNCSDIYTERPIVFKQPSGLTFFFYLSGIVFFQVIFLPHFVDESI